MSRFNRILDDHQQPVNLTFISSYIPRKCGIATFTKDLTTAINSLNPHSPVKIVAMNNKEHHPYPHEVVYSIEKDTIEAYEDAAKYINQTAADMVCLQHEYGLFGGLAGEYGGEYIFKMLSRLRQPIVTTLHTILEKPSDLQRDVLFRIAKLSTAVVAMIPDAKERLEKEYNIDPDKVVVIHHGVTDRPKAAKAFKTVLNWENRQVLLMTGLLSPNKGAEYVIKALPKIKEKFPNILFVLVGETHPEIVKSTAKEEYRENLIKLVADLSLQDNVEFINRYVNLENLLTYYEACDIYLTPHLDAQQITSGTLAYALGMGKACISTPYVYAQEMLADGTGLLVNFHDATEIANACLNVLSNPELQRTLEDRAYMLGRKMSWPLVAERYLTLFRLIKGTHGVGAIMT